jgi:2,3-dihydroxybiphenyl 1,2-dioxygenase
MSTATLIPAPQSLGYIGFRSKDLSDWAGYATGLLGLERIDKARSKLAFRMDNRRQRIIVDAEPGDPLGYLGWEMADAAALHAIAARLEAAGVLVAHGSRALAEERHVADLITLQDPVGNRLELFYGAEAASEPFKPGRNISGFRTGPLGLGHVVMHAINTDEMVKFYGALLGFRLTEYYSSPFKATFMHLNPRHHSLAFIETGKSALHHIMMELYSFDDVGQGYDIAQAEKRVATTLGRHTSDYITSFYSWTPSNFMIEYGWGARDIEIQNWKAHERKEGPSIWGHDRTWLSDEDQSEARGLRLKNASEGYRRPLQVMEGNYRVMAGVCPWWDSVRAGSAAI